MNKRQRAQKCGLGSIKRRKSESSSGTVDNTLKVTERRIKDKNNRYFANPLPAEMEIQNQATGKKTNANEICYTYSKESREIHDSNVEADGETEDSEKKTLGVSLDTCERSQKRKRCPEKLPPGFGFNKETRKFRKDTHGACKKHGSDTSGIHKTPQVNIAQNYKLTKYTSKSVDSCFVINDHNAKRELQDDATVSETCSNIVCSNCENPISDLEDDGIRVSGQLMSFLDHPPVPGDFPLTMPLKKNNASAVFCSCGPTQKRKLCRESKIYIAHKDQDTDKGDYFGAILRTYEEQEECVNYRHFLVDIERGSPAKEMYFKPKDEIILLNRVFSPEFNHEDLLKQFLDVKVDGRTRLELVIRRYCGDKAKNKRKQWIDISAILFPVKHEEHQASARDTKSVPLTDNSFDTFMKRLYRIPGSDYFLQISSSGVNADVIVDVHDKTKDIWKRVHYYETKSGLIVYVAALCDQTKTLYIAVDTKSTVGVSSGIYWYRFKKPGNEISFQLESNDTYFAYDLEKKEAVVQPVEFNFEEFPADAYEIKKALIRMLSASSSDSGLGASISSQSGDRAVKMTVFDNCTPLMTPLIAKSYGLCEKRYLTRSHMTTCTTPSTPNTPTTPLGRLTLYSCFKIPAVFTFISIPENQVLVEKSSFTPLRNNRFDIVRSLHLYEIPGSQLFLKIDNDTVSADVLDGAIDQSKILRRLQYWEDEKTGRIIYAAALCEESMTKYISTDKDCSVVLDTEPQWFHMSKQGADISFTLDGKYFAFDREHRKAVIQANEFKFNEYPANKREVLERLLASSGALASSNTTSQVSILSADENIGKNNNRLSRENSSIDSTSIHRFGRENCNASSSIHRVSSENSIESISIHRVSRENSSIDSSSISIDSSYGSKNRSRDPFASSFDGSSGYGGSLPLIPDTDSEDHKKENIPISGDIVIHENICSSQTTPETSNTSLLAKGLLPDSKETSV